jgi:hypothetical protein
MDEKTYTGTLTADGHIILPERLREQFVTMPTEVPFVRDGDSLRISGLKLGESKNEIADYDEALKAGRDFMTEYHEAFEVLAK